MNHYLTLKMYVKSVALGQSHDLIGNDHVAYQSMRIIDLNTSMVLALRSGWSLSKVVAEKPLVTSNGELANLTLGH